RGRRQLPPGAAFAGGDSPGGRGRPPGPGGVPRAGPAGARACPPAELGGGGGRNRGGAAPRPGRGRAPARGRPGRLTPPMQETLEPYSGRRVLVTGGTGFIGLNLVEALSRSRASLRVLRRSWPSPSPAARPLLDNAELV